MDEPWLNQHEKKQQQAIVRADCALWKSCISLYNFTPSLEINRNLVRRKKKPLRVIN